ncbi:MAG: hypothetical protein QMD71_01585 [bacterium]|nr:hypothetical protein [bacterium]
MKSRGRQLSPWINIKKRVRRFEILVKTGSSVMIFLASFGGGLFLYLVLDYIFFLPSWIRLLSLILVSIVSISFVAKAILSKFDPINELEKNFPKFNGQLLASISYYPEILGYSDELIYEVRRQTERMLKSINIRSEVKRKLKPLVKLPIISCALTVAFILFLPSPKSIWVKRFFSPNHKFISLTVYPGDKIVTYGDSLEIRVTAKEIVPRKLAIVVDGNYITLYKKFGFKTTMQQITQDIIYYARVSDVSSDTHKILVTIRPWVKDLNLVYNYPEYTKIAQVKTTSPIIEALYGTRIEIEGEANINLKKASLQFNKTPDIPLEVEGKRFKASFNATHNDSYRIFLSAANGLENLNPESYPIRVWNDEPPKVDILFPATDIEMPATMKIPIIFHTIDDYGISKSKLVTDKGEQLITNEIGPDTVISYNWDVSGFELLPADILKYWIEVYDNDAFKGPKCAKSETYKIYFPTVEDIYKQVTGEQAKTMDELQKVIEDLKAVSERLETITPQTGIQELSWEEKEKIKEVIEKGKEIEKKIEGLKSDLNELYKRMENTMWVDKDLMDKVKELQTLFAELNLPELNEAIRKLEEAVQKNPEMLADAIKNLNLTQDELRKRIENTIELLKKFKQEQMLKSLAEEASKLQEWQQSINEKTERGEEALTELAKEEQALSEELAKLAQELDKLSKESTSLKENLEQEERRASEIRSQLNQAANELAKSSRPIKLQQRILEQLSRLTSNLNSLYQQMIQQGKEQVAQQIKRLENELLFLSVEEEGLGKVKTFQSGVGLGLPTQTEGDLLDMAFRQEALIKGTKNVSDELKSLMTITPFISSSAMQHISNSLSSMESAKRGFEERNLAKAQMSQKIAMAELNKAVTELMKAEDALQSASSAYGMQELMQQLAQLTQKQQGLNQMIQSLLPMSLAPSEQMQALADLIGQQQAISEELKQIAEGLKGKVLGDLGGVAQEMEKLAKDLQKGITDEIVKRQEDILKHLLDAQKSIYTKKYSRRRISEPGENFTNLPSPPQPKLVTKRGISQKDIIKALKEKYPKEYESLIRAYFRILSTE